MPDHTTPPVAGAPVALDEEIRYRPIWVFLIALFAVSAFSFALIWGSIAFLNQMAAKADGPATVESRRQGPPPEPRLEASPPATLRAVRAEETAILEGWGWADPSKSHARIPLSRAIEIVAARGLPTRSSSSVSTPTPVAVVDPAPAATAGEAK